MNKKFKLLLRFMKGNRLLYMGAILCMVLATALSLVSPLIVKTTIDSIIGNKPMDAPAWMLYFINKVGGKGVLAKNLWICSAALLAFGLFEGFFSFLRGKWLAKASETVAKNIRDMLYDHIQNVSYEYHVKTQTGDLIQRCTSDVETIRRFISRQFIQIGRCIFMLVISLYIMLSLNMKMTLISMIVVPLIFAFSFIFFTKIKEIFKVCDEAEAKVSTVLQENLTGVRVVRAFGREAFEEGKFADVNKHYRDESLRLSRLMATYWSLSDFLVMLQGGLVLVIGVYWAAKGNISLGTLVVFINYSQRLLWPIRQMGRILTDMGKTQVSLGRIQEILDEPLETVEQNKLTPPIHGQIKFKNVYFQYEEERPILKDISFSVKSGQTVGILGPTGCGKSSLMHLLLRLYDYQQGSILLDNVELKDIDKKWLRRHVGIVLQEPFLFSKTIKENISLAKPGVHEKEIFDAAKIAAIHNSIQDLEQGYQTPVGERGVTLSGGQKQRVAIARTIIRKNPIMIFDDSLSAVDTETDQAIRKALKEKCQDSTTFIISHRITTISEADIILVMEHGKIIESGTHEQLIAQNGLYKKIWNLQNSLEEEFNKNHNEGLGA